MKITEILLAEHVVFHNLFDHIEKSAPRLPSLRARPTETVLPRQEFSAQRMRLRGRNVTAHADLITDPAEVERLLGVIAVGNPRATRFIPLPRRADGSLEPEPLAAAIAHGFCIVRWHLGAAA